jgi:hypothetical protein
LFGDVEPPCFVWIVPVASICLSKNGIQRLLDAAGYSQSLFQSECSHLRRFYVPAAHVELDDGHETLDGIIDFRN